MAWIESHQTLEKNGKLLEFANILSINKYQAIGHIHALWWWALDNAEDGNLKRFSNAAVTQACGWSDYLKDEQEMSRVNEVTNRDKGGDFFVEALIKSGFLDKRAQDLFIHNWEAYTHRYFQSVTKSTKKKYLTRLRVQKHRRSNAAVTPVKRHVTPPTIPNLTIPIEEKTLAQKARATDLLFQTFWTEYPKRMAKAQAKKAWDKLRPNEELLRKIVESLSLWKDSAQWQKEKGQFIPYPATWLNQRRWEDEIAEEKREVVG